MKRSFYLIPLLIGAMACGHEEELIDESFSSRTRSEVPAALPDSYSLGASLACVQEIARTLESGHDAPAPQMVQSSLLDPASTRMGLICFASEAGGSPRLDTLVYVVKIRQSKGGFALVGHDERFEQIIAFVPEGDFDYERFARIQAGTQEDSCAGDFIYELLGDYLSASDLAYRIRSNSMGVNDDDRKYNYRVISDDNIMIDDHGSSDSGSGSGSPDTGYRGRGDEDGDSAPGIIERPPYKQPDYRTVDHLAPLLRTTWHQDAPFNKYCFTGDGKQASAGCVAIAVGQVVNYYRFPAAFRGRTFDWDLIGALANGVVSGGAADQAARLIASVGEVVINHYGKKASSGTMRKARICLESMGYRHVDKYNSYRENKIVAELKARRPVLIGARTKGGSGHAWVIDGYMEQRSVGSGYNPNTDLSAFSRYLLHCNFGWQKWDEKDKKIIYGYKNGYYASGIFNTTQGPVISDDEDEDKEGSEPEFAADGAGTIQPSGDDHFNRRYRIVKCRLPQ